MGAALVDRRVYLPKFWTNDRTRCEQAGVPNDVAFAIHSQLADDMIITAVDAQAPVLHARRAALLPVRDPGQRTSTWTFRLVR